MKLAHAQLLRYAQDLKLAYEAERDHRTELAHVAQVAIELVTMLAVLPVSESAGRVGDPVA